MFILMVVTFVVEFYTIRPRVIIHKRDDGYCDAPSVVLRRDSTMYDWTWKLNQLNRRSFE